MLEKRNNQEKLINYKKLFLKGGNKVDTILDTVKKMNNQEEQANTADILELETEEEAAERQRGQGLKILTPK